WHPECPICKAPVVVRLAEGGYTFAFWRCARWPDCPFASWRPRAPGDCPACGAPRFWSYSRKSIGCPNCGQRANMGPLEAPLDDGSPLHTALARGELRAVCFTLATLGEGRGYV